MKRLLLSLLLVLPSYCASTTIVQQIAAPDGSLASGTLNIRISAPCKSGSVYVGDKTIVVKFTGGAFSVPLIPNDTCVPSGTSYTVSWLLTGGTTRTQTWVVPTSGSTVTVDSVVVNTIPVPAVLFQPQQIYAAGLANGTYCLNVQSGAVIGLTACSGSGGSLSWTGLSNSQWTSMTNTQWTSLGN